MHRVASLGAIACPLTARRDAGRLSQYPRSFSLAPLWLLATRIWRVFRRAYDRTAFHSWFLHSCLLVHVEEAVERRRLSLASRGRRNHLSESAGTLPSAALSGAVRSVARSAVAHRPETAYFVEKLGWAPPIERLAGGQRL